MENIHWHYLIATIIITPLLIATIKPIVKKFTDNPPK